MPLSRRSSGLSSSSGTTSCAARGVAEPGAPPPGERRRDPPPADDGAGDRAGERLHPCRHHRRAGAFPQLALRRRLRRTDVNRGGDRAANSALHIIAIGWLRTDQRTKDYVAKRIAEGHSKLDAIRALKRYIAREVFTLIRDRQKEIGQARSAA